MNVVFTEKSLPFTGLHSTVTALGHNTVMWLPKIKPVFDMFEEMQPDILFIQNNNLTSTICNAINQYPNTRVIMCGSPQSLPFNPALWCVPEEIESNLTTGCPQMIFKYAANIALLRGGIYNKRFDSDLFYLSNIHVNDRMYVIKNLYDTIYPLKYKLRICGDVYLPIPSYVGSVSTKDSMKYLTSTKINIDFDHTIILDAAANKVFTISNLENPYFPSFDSKDSCQKLIHDFVNKESSRRKIAKKAYNQIIDKETYFHRWQEIGFYLGEKWDIDHILMRLRG